MKKIIVLIATLIVSTLALATPQPRSLHQMEENNRIYTDNESVRMHSFDQLVDKYEDLRIREQALRDELGKLKKDKSSNERKKEIKGELEKINNQRKKLDEARKSMGKRK